MSAIHKRKANALAQGVHWTSARAPAATPSETIDAKPPAATLTVRAFVRPPPRLHSCRLYDFRPLGCIDRRRRSRWTPGGDGHRCRRRNTTRKMSCKRSSASKSGPASRRGMASMREASNASRVMWESWPPPIRLGSARGAGENLGTLGRELSQSCFGWPLPHESVRAAEGWPKFNPRLLYRLTPEGFCK